MVTLFGFLQRSNMSNTDKEILPFFIQNNKNLA